MKKLLTSKTIKRVVVWAIYVLVAVFIYITLRENARELKGFRFANVWLFAPAVLAFSVQFFVNAVTWMKLMDFAGEEVGFRDSMRVYINSFIVRYVPGSVLAIAARAGLNKEHGVRISSSIWGWVIENVTYLLIGMILSLFILLRVESIPVEIVYAILVALPVCAIFLLRYEILDKFVNFVVERKFPEVVQKEVGMFQVSLKHRAVLVGMYLAAWVFFSAQFILVNYAVAGDFGAPLLELVGVNALAWSMGYISLITPSGAGVREGVMILALTGLGIAGGVEAIAITLAARVTAIIGELLLFGAFQLYYLKIKKS